MPAKVEIFTRPGCSYCEAVKLLFTRKGTEFALLDVWADPGQRDELRRRDPLALTLPQVFVGGARIGGFEDVYGLEGDGRLDRLLEEAP